MSTLRQHIGWQSPGVQGPKEVLIAVILFLAFLIPGLIYYIVVESIPYCTACGRRVSKKAWVG